MSTIKVNDSGPYIVTGSFKLIDAQGNEFETKRAIALCRCGHSANKPFCDGEHNKHDFKNNARAVKE